MFSVTYTGMNFLPLCTATVWPDEFGQNGRAPRPGTDHFLLVRGVHARRSSSPGGIDERPFFKLTSHASRPTSSLSALHDQLVGPLVVARLVAARGLAPRRHRMPAAGGLALAAAVRVVHRIHHDAAVVRLCGPATGCGRPCRATRSRDRRCRPGRWSPCNPPTRAASRPRGASAARSRLLCETNCACAPAERAICPPLPGFSSMLCTTVPAGIFFSGSALPTRMSASGPETTVRPTVEPDRAKNVALLAVGVVQQRDPRRAVRIVFDRRHLGRNARLVALEIDLPVGLLAPPPRHHMVISPVLLRPPRPLLARRSGIFPASAS